MWSHILLFPNNQWPPFYVLVGQFYIYFVDMSIHVFGPSLSWVVYYQSILSSRLLSDMIFNYFFPVFDLFLHSLECIYFESKKALILMKFSLSVYLLLYVLLMSYLRTCCQVRIMKVYYVFF